MKRVKGQKYWWIYNSGVSATSLVVTCCPDEFTKIDDTRYENGNYYLSFEEAEASKNKAINDLRK